MATQVIKSGHVPYEILKILAGTPALANRLRAYFAPRCDCDISDYIKTKIQQGDQQIINAIKSMIAADVGAIPAYPETNLSSVNGDRFVLRSTYLVGGDLWGNFTVFNGTTSSQTTNLIEAASP